MNWRENRALAWLALALCAFMSVFGLGGMKLSRERAHALEVFASGEGDRDYVQGSMASYLANAAESAQIMAAEAEQLGGSPAVYEAVAAAAKVLGDPDAEPGARWEAYKTLKTDVDALYNAVYTEDKSAFAQFKLAYDDFWGDDDLIRRDAYPALARSYNRLVAGFPGSLVARLTGNGKLETFGG